VKTTRHSFVDTLRQAFFDGIIKGGQPLTEDVLCRMFNVSRTPVREALIRLEYEGLVTIVKNKGAFAREMTPTDVIEIFQLRLLLEGHAARTCISSIDAEQLGRIRDQLLAMRPLPGMEDEKNNVGHTLHMLIKDSSPNIRFKNLLTGLYTQFTRVRDLARLIPGRTEKTLEQHLAIADQMLVGNAEGAEEAMRFHLHSTLTDLIDPVNMQIFTHVNISRS
jgi:DNA-binding GntR family transcriptional regulator